MTVRTVHIEHCSKGWVTRTGQREERHPSQAAAFDSAMLWAFVYRPACVVMDTPGEPELIQYYPDRAFDAGRVASELPGLYL